MQSFLDKEIEWEKKRATGGLSENLYCKNVQMQCIDP